MRNSAGGNIRYLVRDRFGRPVACALFGSAAWKCADRDAFIGWERTTRERNLQHLTNNTRFLIPRWVRVPHLASHVLGLIARRIRSDWQEKYGHPEPSLPADPNAGVAPSKAKPSTSSTASATTPRASSRSCTTSLFPSTTTKPNADCA